MTPSSAQLPLPAMPTLPGMPAPFGMSPSGGSKPQAKGPQATFLGSASLPSQSNLGYKTLLGM